MELVDFSEVPAGPNTLEEVSLEDYTTIVRDATIQRFEYTFELAWKLLQKIARIEGVLPVLLARL